MINYKDMIGDILIFTSILLLMFVPIMFLTDFAPPIHKIGLPVYPKDLFWICYIYLNLNNLKRIDNDYFYIKGKVIHFFDPDSFDVYRGETVDEIGSKYSLGSHCNKCTELTFWEKYIGNKITNWYLKQN